MPFGLFDPSFILLIPAMILAFWAQSKVKSTFNKYSRVRSASGMTGAQTARRILDASGLSEVPVTKTRGDLTDHYHPTKRELFLSETVFDSNSVSALGVAAHEVGHAIQHQNLYLPLKVRNAFVPVANIGSNLALPLFLVGFIFSSISWLMDVGIFFFVGAVAFSLITLPVEFNASSRAIAVLQGMGYLQGKEIEQAKAVLNAAAWTYVAAATMALSQLIRLLILRSSRD
jgi:Zn-dependent membrane protease YugP